MSDIHIPTVTLPKPEGEFQIVDPADVRFDGDPFPWPTIGAYSIAIEADGLLVMTVQFPIRLVTSDG